MKKYKIELTEPQLKLLQKMVDHCEIKLDREQILRFVAETGYVDHVYDRIHQRIQKIVNEPICNNKPTKD